MGNERYQKIGIQLLCERIYDIGNVLATILTYPLLLLLLLLLEEEEEEEEEEKKKIVIIWVSFSFHWTYIPCVQTEKDTHVWTRHCCLWRHTWSWRYRIGREANNNA